MKHWNDKHRYTPLASSHLQVTITDLVAEYELRHVFRNQRHTAIEAVYSFPVPLDAAFMGMEATLAGERRVADLLPKKQATRHYDDALADGDSAVLLESLRPGLLCVSLGNLKPSESGEIVLRFAALLPSADGGVRFSLPLVHRPRYGRLRDEMDEPANDFSVEHPLEASIRIKGLLARQPVNCASHAVRFSIEDDAQCLRLNQAMLDRDLVLAFDLPADFSGQARLLADGDACIGLVTATIPVNIGNSGPCDVCLVLDGSGSMSGDAIAQSRDALRAVADTLTEDDRIQILRFGSEVTPLFRRPLRATSRVREAMMDLAPLVKADLGGTKIGDALDHALKGLATLAKDEGRRQAIILVTDGAVQPQELVPAQERAKAAGVRVFVVAVGSSAGVDVLAPLAAATQAVLERAVPAEPIDEAVLRQLHRARQSGPVAVTMDWGSSQARAVPLAATYAGDALTAIAQLPAGHEAQPRIQIADQEARSVRLSALEHAPALRAVAGMAIVQHARGDDRARLALHYGLITQDTSAVLVKVRADGDKVDGLPQVMPVSPMQPEGMVAPPPAIAMKRAYSVRGGDYLDIPSFFCRKGAPRVDEVVATMMICDELLDALSPDRRARAQRALREALDFLLLAPHHMPISLDSLLTRIAAELHEDVRQLLREEGAELLDEAAAIRLLQWLTDSGVGAPLSDDDEAMLAGWSARLVEA